MFFIADNCLDDRKRVVDNKDQHLFLFLVNNLMSYSMAPATDLRVMSLKPTETFTLLTSVDKFKNSFHCQILFNFIISKQ